MLELDARTYEGFVGAEGVAVIDMWAPWCGPCRAFAPRFEEVAERMSAEGDGVRFAKLNVDEAGEVAISESVASIPTVVIYRDGTKVAMHVGVMGEEDLLAAIRDEM